MEVKINDLNSVLGNVSLAAGQHEFHVECPFPIQWCWLQITPNTPMNHCGGSERNTVAWAAHRHKLTIIADIVTDEATITWCVIGYPCGG
jgi:hypothetical protein